ncbi:unnamed protein product [Vicia faba]|uniref:Uncharacterized protein n=1 Tax=Vicia faba TaxID=3906 RepID=A0AAV0ZTE0_VICFA|nr:unnamed protein product [Vicia faba]
MPSDPASFLFHRSAYIKIRIIFTLSEPSLEINVKQERFIQPVFFKLGHKTSTVTRRESPTAAVDGMKSEIKAPPHTFLFLSLFSDLWFFSIKQ